ncbi:MAG: BrnA antitoxin family protein [Acidobacteriia bacterium]|nr:BrnA antitoxin family protein [Terriglobia bacterium]
MKKLTNKQRQKQLQAIAAIPDGRIDASDIPELTEEQLRGAIRGQMYRPIKKPVTMRLDADVIAWLKHDGPGYQTKANALLRREMIRSHQEKKGPDRASGNRGSGKHESKKRAR